MANQPLSRNGPQKLQNLVT